MSAPAALSPSPSAPGGRCPRWKVVRNLSLQLLITTGATTAAFGAEGYWLAGLMGPAWVLAGLPVALTDLSQPVARALLVPGGICYVLLTVVVLGMAGRLPGGAAHFALFFLNVVSVFSLALIA